MPPRVAPGDEFAGVLVVAVAEVPGGQVAQVDTDLGERVLEVPAA